MKYQVSLGHILSLMSFYSILALIFAYISQYFFDMQPCILCLYQRIPFFLIIGFCLFLVAINKRVRQSLVMKKLVFFISILLLTVNCGLAFYHTLVEKKIVSGPTNCSSSGSLENLDNITDLEKALEGTKAVRCDEPQFVFAYLSMASWNFIYCLMIIIVSINLYRKSSPETPL